MNERQRDGERAGLVLAGGYSTRFGDVDKAFVELDGQPLIAHVIERLGDAVDGILVSCRTEQVPLVREVIDPPPVGICTVEDPVPGRGPTAGIAASLRGCRAPYTAIVAGDNPLVDPSFVHTLFERAEGQDGAVPRIGGRLQPTHAVYRTDAMMKACETVLESDDSSLLKVIDALDLVVVSEAVARSETDLRRFVDINTPADFERAAERYDRLFSSCEPNELADEVLAKRTRGRHGPQDEG